VRVALTPEAERDLEEIGDWIARESPRRAISFVAELRAACAGLADNALRFQLVDRRKRLDVRRRPYGNYLIFYRVRGDAVEILHVLHGARDFSTMAFPDDLPE
jgi:plasmid stabilization system protein ParE